VAHTIMSHAIWLADVVIAQLRHLQLWPND
jgi:hypothetical protein